MSCVHTDYHSVFREFLVETFGSRACAIEIEVEGFGGCDEVNCTAQE